MTEVIEKMERTVRDIPTLKSLAARATLHQDSAQWVKDGNRIIGVTNVTPRDRGNTTVWFEAIAHTPVYIENCSVNDAISRGYIHAVITFPTYAGYRELGANKYGYYYIDNKATRKQAIDRTKRVSDLIVKLAFITDGTYRVTIIFTKYFDGDPLLFAMRDIPKPITREFAIIWHRRMNIYTLEYKKVSVGDKIHKHPRFKESWIPEKLFPVAPRLVTSEEMISRLDKWVYPLMIQI